MDVLREYLYVDFDKVTGLASQLYEGVPETTEEARKDTTRGQIGSRNIALLGKEREVDVTDKKALADSLFPAIERDLETELYLTDISDLVADAAKLKSGELADSFPPGSIVRITAPGRIIDPRYFARAMAGFAIAVNGFSVLPGEPASPPPPTSRSGKSSRPAGRKTQAGAEPEEGIPDFPAGLFPQDQGISAEALRGMVKVMRGMYPEGVSMQLSPAGVGGPGIALRLQEGRRYLDAQPETLVARYGLGLQEWTIVGMIGYHAAPSRDLSFVNVLENGQRINRGKLTAMVNDFLELMAAQGLAEMAQAPGFSVVPIAVYRVIPRAGTTVAD